MSELRKDLIADLLCKKGSFIHAHVDVQMRAQVCMRLGQDWSQEKVLYPSDRFTVGSAVRDGNAFLLSLFPTGKTEYSHILTHDPSGFVFELYGSSGEVSARGDLNCVIAALLASKSESGVTWDRFIENAVRIENHRAAVASGMAENKDYGSW